MDRLINVLRDAGYNVDIAYYNVVGLQAALHGEDWMPPFRITEHSATAAWVLGAIIGRIANIIGA